MKRIVLFRSIQKLSSIESTGLSSDLLFKQVIKFKKLGN